MEPTDAFAPQLPTPTVTRPLLGLTILVVEDSRFASEAMRLLCLRSGARIRRADCLRSARRHLQVYRPSVIVVDLGLPDGDGADLIRELAAMDPRESIIIGTSGDPEKEAEAMACGAEAFIAKPITSLAVFQQAILATLPAERRPSGLRVVNDEEIAPDEIAYHDDMTHVADVLGDLPSDRTLDYVAQFLGGVARSAKDDRMADAVQALADKRASGAPAASETARLAGLIQKRLMRKIAI
ncbi:response regulator [Sulfitobacter sp. S190]|uniref:response regulator n=1 Tax=Sulfitobacter sp. S190 TaxID=2867022 RepID=UPI0021A6A418|nr:response regulator [Sulfitobacter sp. S190]UWR22114.1 response regulator [Sulfitobacter sp. S190]